MELNFDTEKYILGSLCKNNHNYMNTGQSLRSLKKNPKKRQSKFGNCLQCSKEYKKQEYEANKEKHRKRSKEYAMKNREKFRRYSKKHAEKYKNDSEYIAKRRARYRKHYHKNIEESRAYLRNYGKENRERIRMLERTYYQTEAGKATQFRKDVARRLRKKKAQIEKIPDYALLYLRDMYRNMCAYCGCKENLVMDHFIPISKNGTHEIKNLVLACRSCNSSKRDKEAYRWYVEQSFFNEERLCFLIENLEKINFLVFDYQKTNQHISDDS